MGTCCWRRGKDGSGRLELALTEKEDVDPFLRGEELGVGLDPGGHRAGQRGEPGWRQEPGVLGARCVGSQRPAEVTWGSRVGETRGGCARPQGVS